VNPAEASRRPGAEERPYDAANGSDSESMHGEVRELLEEFGDSSPDPARAAEVRASWDALRANRERP
jgi:hypothetical protein